jgi:hypothetical protein
MTQFCRIVCFGTSLVLLAAVAGSGCRRSGPAGLPTPTPAESFDMIVDTIRRGIETGSGALVSGGGTPDGGYAAIAVENKVTSEYLPPAADGESPRGTVTVDSTSRVTIQRPQPARDERSTRGEGAEEGDDRTTAREVLDPTAAGRSAGDSGRRSGRTSTAPLPEVGPKQVVRTFELVHRGGRWHLVSEIDQKNDRAVYDAIQYALRTQP